MRAKNEKTAHNTSLFNLQVPYQDGGFGLFDLPTISWPDISTPDDLQRLRDMAPTPPPLS